MIFCCSASLLRRRCRDCTGRFFGSFVLRPSWLFDFAPSSTFPSCRIESYDILIRFNNGSTLALKIYSICLRELILKVRDLFTRSDLKGSYSSSKEKWQSSD
ncbi:hypothetical protein KFK09_003503 [Dendrobium nobile]|uniref:Uncharacterized protein n=1 Tax=Dendrobium nobile TaxID=94219 RepID=A0A8T3BY06_DENNO|nr:hypothetical protein KFK09_003503 [Dendrobium nobile]